MKDAKQNEGRPERWSRRHPLLSRLLFLAFLIVLHAWLHQRVVTHELSHAFLSGGTHTSFADSVTMGGFLVTRVMVFLLGPVLVAVGLAQALERAFEGTSEKR